MVAMTTHSKSVSRRMNLVTKFTEDIVSNSEPVFTVQLCEPLFERKRRSPFDLPNYVGVAGAQFTLGWYTASGILFDAPETLHVMAPVSDEL